MVNKGKKPGSGKKRKKVPDDHPFASLQTLRDELIESEPDTRVPQRSTPPAKPSNPSASMDDDGAPPPFDFEAEMDDVAPINRGKPRVAKKRRPAPKKTTPAPTEDDAMLRTLGLWVDKQVDFQLAEDAERIEGAVSGLNPKTRRKLRQGGFALQDHLDLHGMDSISALEAIEQFILDAINHNQRCVLIVHGKGLHSKSHEPVLKNALKKWLTRGIIGRCILAFTTALPCDGGYGAVYVLLRKTSARGDGKKVILQQE